MFKRLFFFFPPIWCQVSKIQKVLNTLFYLLLFLPNNHILLFVPHQENRVQRYILWLFKSHVSHSIFLICYCNTNPKHNWGLSVPSVEYLHWRVYYCNRQKEQRQKHSLHFTWGSVTGTIQCSLQDPVVPLGKGGMQPLNPLSFDLHP